MVQCWMRSRTIKLVGSSRQGSPKSRLPHSVTAASLPVLSIIHSTIIAGTAAISHKDSTATSHACSCDSNSRVCSSQLRHHCTALIGRVTDIQTTPPRVAAPSTCACAGPELLRCEQILSYFRKHYHSHDDELREYEFCLLLVTAADTR